MLSKKQINRIQFFSIIALMLSLIAFTQLKDSKLRCNKVNVSYSNKEGVNFIKKEQVYNLLTNFGKEPLEGKYISEINFSKLEKRALSKSLIKKCEVYSNQHGDVNVEIETYVPVARVLDNNGRNDRYLASNGNLFRLGAGFTPKVLLVGGSYFSKKENIKDTNVIELINEITNSEFWNSQVAQMNISKNGEIRILPQFGNHMIEFGDAESSDKKLRKLKLFYENAYSDKKYNKFSEISVKYKNQIVCK